MFRVSSAETTAETTEVTSVLPFLVAAIAVRVWIVRLLSSWRPTSPVSYLRSAAALRFTHILLGVQTQTPPAKAGGVGTWADTGYGQVAPVLAPSTAGTKPIEFGFVVAPGAPAWSCVQKPVMVA